MTERKFTDEEVIKALECCTSAECNNCKWEPQGVCYRGSMECNDDLMREALNLINRQRAEIERLKSEAKIDEAEIKCTRIHRDRARAEAIKEFAERLLDKYDIWTESNATEYQYVAELVNNLVKEMTESKEKLK